MAQHCKHCCPWYVAGNPSPPSAIQRSPCTTHHLLANATTHPLPSNAHRSSSAVCYRSWCTQLIIHRPPPTAQRPPPRQPASWNSTVLEYYSVAPLEHNTDLTYTAACPDCGGLVSSRDFYIARRVAKRNLPDGRVSFGSGGVSVPVASDQGRPRRTRGWNDVSGFVVIAPPDDAESCSVVWVINSDLRGWVS